MEYPIHEFMFSDDPEATMRGHLRAGIAERRLASSSAAHPGDRELRLLLVGYSGAHNTGADSRVAEIVRQLHTLYAGVELRIGLTTIGPSLPDALRGVEMEPISEYFPQFIHAACDRYDGILACEGSMFTSTFSDSLSAMMAGALGHAGVAGKLSVGYGGEAGAMSPALEDFVREHCAGSLLVARNRPSHERLAGLGLRVRLGADTAWTYRSPAPDQARAWLAEAGWDGNEPVLVVCPINPFWWPVKPDPGRAMRLQLQGQRSEAQYGAFSFHHESDAATRRYLAYLDGLAGAVRRYRRQRRVFPVIVGMEQLDARACRDLAERIDGKPPVLVAGEQPMDRLIGVLRQADLLASSRFHALVLSMPAGVPSCGIAMDGRIEHLLRARGPADLLLQADDAALEEKLCASLERLETEREAIREACLCMVAAELRRLGEMGRMLVEETARLYPNLPLIDAGADWRRYLPPLDEQLRGLIAGQA